MVLYVIEHYVESKACEWHTRLNASKYESYAQQQAEAFAETTLFNQMPTSWRGQVPSVNIYSSSGGYDVIAPRRWAFEIYADFQEVAKDGKGPLIVHLYSKLHSRMWPNFTLVAKRAKMAVQELMNGTDRNAV